METRPTLLRSLLVGGSALAAVLVLLAPPLPQWGERHAPHVHKPPLTLSSGQVVEQTVRFEARSLDLALLWTDTTVPLPSEGNVLLTVERAGATREARVAFRDVPPSGILVFALTPPLDAPAGSPGVLRVRLTHPGQTIALTYQSAERIYQDGALRYPSDRRVHGDLAFQLRYRRPALGTRTRQGLTALSIVLAGTVAAFLSRPSVSPTPPRPRLGRRDVWLVLAIGAAVAAFYGIFLLRPGFWVGPTDFSKDAAYLATSAAAVRSGSWPVWSHLTCGGMAALGNPEGSTMSLGTILALALPPDRALLLLLTLEAGIGAAGAVVLARLLGLSALGSATAAIVSLLSASFAYRIIEGLTPVGGAVAFLPWVFVALVRALRARGGPWVILAGSALGAMFLRGDVHLVVGAALTVAVWCAVEAARQRSWNPVSVLVGVATVAALFGSIKILPYLEQPSLIGGDLPPYVVPFTRAGLLDDVFLSVHNRTVNPRPLHGRRPESWGNFGMYVGVLPLVLGGLGLLTKHPFRTPLALAALTAFLLSEGTLFEVALRHVGPLDVLLRIPSRLWSIFTLFLGLAAGLGLDRVAHAAAPSLLRRGLALLLLLALTADLGRATAVVFGQNLRWNLRAPRLTPDDQTLLPHAAAAPDDEHHPTKLLRAGFLLPKICGDQNNPPIFVKELRTPTPIASVPAELLANGIRLSAPAGPTDIIVRERFTSSWTTSHGTLVENADESVHLLMPRGNPTTVTLTYRNPLRHVEQLLTAVLFVILGVILARAPWHRAVSWLRTARP